MFEIGDKWYDLKFNMLTIMQIEAVTKENIISVMQRTNGVLSITDLRTYFSYALYTDVGTRVSPKQAFNMSKDWIEELGFLEVNGIVVDAIMRDCPFLFKVG